LNDNTEIILNDFAAAEKQQPLAAQAACEALTTRIKISQIFYTNCGNQIERFKKFFSLLPGQACCMR